MTYQAMQLTEGQAAEVWVDSAVWEQAVKSPRFVNIENGKTAIYSTRAAVLWSEGRLFVKFWAQEPFLRATLKERDALLFNENNVELFIDGGDSYYELEINALNVVYEVLFVWKDAFDTNRIFRRPELEPPAQKAYTFGGNHDRDAKSFWRGTHPRGIRWAFTDWDLPGLVTQVGLQGTLNDDSDEDVGWEALVSIPWRSLEIFADGRPLPPKEGDVWKLQLARYELVEELDTNIGWAWTPVGSNDNHVPERFTPITFTERYLTSDDREGRGEIRR